MFCKVKNLATAERKDEEKNNHIHTECVVKYSAHIKLNCTWNSQLSHLICLLPKLLISLQNKIVREVLLVHHSCNGESFLIFVFGLQVLFIYITHTCRKIWPFVVGLRNLIRLVTALYGGCAHNFLARILC